VLGPAEVLDVVDLERRARSLERAVHCRDARREEDRDLGRTPAEDLAEQKDGALSWWQVVNDGCQRQPEILAREDQLGRVERR
jgi:hypothetical protein